jgi:hypothetical protein
MKAKAKTESNMASLAVIGVDIGKELPRRHRAARLRCLARPQHPAKRPWKRPRAHRYRYRVNKQHFRDAVARAHPVMAD